MPNQFDAAERIAQRRGITRPTSTLSACAASSWPNGPGTRAASTVRSSPSSPRGDQRGRADRQQAHRRPRPGPARHHRRVARRAQAGHRGRPAHRGHLVADLRRCCRVLLMDEAKARRWASSRAPGCVPRHWSARAVLPPRRPGPATERVLAKSGMSLSDIDLVEIRGLRLGRAELGAGSQRRHGQGERQRRRHRVGTPRRLYRRPPDHDRPPRAGAPRRRDRADHHVRRRRALDRHDHRRIDRWLHKNAPISWTRRSWRR